MRVAQEPTASVPPLVPGWIAAGVTLAIALALTLFRATNDVQPGVDAVGLLGFFAAFAGPGLVAAVGLTRGRRGPLVAAAAVLVCLSPLSMGGVTLPLLIPAILLIYTAGRLPVSGLHRARSLIFAVLTFGLLAAAPIALFTTTEVVCWDDYGGGNVVVQVLPEMPTGEQAIAPFGGGCSSGSISTRGGSLAILAVTGAVIVAAGSGRRP